MSQNRINLLEQRNTNLSEGGEENMLDVTYRFLPIGISLVALIFSVYVFYRQKRTEREDISKGISAKKYYVNQFNFNDLAGINILGVPMGVKIKNTSKHYFTNVFLFAVYDYNYNSSVIDDLSGMIELGYWAYIEKIIEEELSVVIPSGGAGMSKSSNILMLYTDFRGKEWLQLPNGKCFRCKNYLRNLLELGLPNPDYRFKNGIIQ